MDYKVLDRDESGELRSVFFPMVDQHVSVYVTDDGTEYYPGDFQGEQAQSCAEMADYEWTPSSEIDY